MVWRADDPQGAEAMKILWELVPYTRGIGLDVGCGPHKAFPHFIGVDNLKDTELFNVQMNPDVRVKDATQLAMFATDSLDFVFSSHMLEHVEDYQGCLREWWRLIKPGGHLCLYLPHKMFYPNIGQEGANPDHKHDFMPQDIVDAMKTMGSWDLLRNEDRSEDMEYSFFQVYRKVETNGQFVHRYPCMAPRPEKKAAVVRYGAWGDAMQASSILPELKAQGFHITFYTTPRAYEVIKLDPHIDEFIIQDNDQVPNAALGPFWKNEQKKFDRWINLSESVERTFLAFPDETMHRWPKEARHAVLDKNYIEMHHKIGQVPYTRPNIRFYPAEEEKEWAIKQRAALGSGPVILWIMSGSSVHKVWPHFDTVWARLLLKYPDAHVIACGDQKCSFLLAPWENESHIIKTPGIWSIRQTLAMINHVDVVVGPETGVLSAAAMVKVPKIVFLSHSTHENLTRDWYDTYALFSRKTKCYPCHQMHYDWDHCNRNDDRDPEGVAKPWNGSAQCQVDIEADHCWAAIELALESWNKKHSKLERKVIEIAR